MKTIIIKKLFLAIPLLPGYQDKSIHARGEVKYRLVRSKSKV